jgi:hypothetical protein
MISDTFKAPEIMLQLAYLKSQPDKAIKALSG